MTKTIAGVSYDTERDEEIVGECKLENGDFLALRKTGEGHYYILRVISQMWKDGSWHSCHTAEDLLGAGITSLPDPRKRLLETIRPVSKSEALHWWAENFTPDEFKEIALDLVAVCKEHEKAANAH
jgi:hypothetical protein